MKTLDETYELIEGINEEAHNDAWDAWMAADAEEDDVLAEELREEASDEQSSWFRHYYWQLEEEDRRAIIYWIIKDADFADQFKDWYNHDAFDEEIELE